MYMYTSAMVREARGDCDVMVTSSLSTGKVANKSYITSL